MDGDPADSGLPPFDLSGVETHADLQAEIMGGLDHLEAAAEGSCRRVEDRHDAISGELDVLAMPALDDASHGQVIRVEELPPGSIAQRRWATGRVDDVGEHDGGQRPADVFGGLEGADPLLGPRALLDERTHRAPSARFL